ncbi:MAG: carboxypeptidase-like regulatory domain-containing protein [Bacteroidales bacterium]|nr:carboxypeptidase-like regulatory domain-containing protein [Bacteroidales bacterium]
MKWFFNILLIPFCMEICIAQSIQNKTISCFVKDSSTGIPVSGVSIKVIETGNGTYTNNKGYFKLNISKLPVTLIVSHVGYNEKKIRVEDNYSGKNEIFLSLKINFLPTVTINSKPVESIIKNKPLFISDYELYNDKILLIAYREKNCFKPAVYLINSEGDSLSSTSVENSGKFFKDCMDYEYLITKNAAFQIHIYSGKIQFLFPVSSNNLYEKLKPCIENINDKFFLQKYYQNDQILVYYDYDDSGNKLKELKVITDETNLRRFYDAHGLMQTQGMNEFEERFEKMCFYKPVYSPLIKIKDTVIVFNLIDSKIEFYSETGDLLKETKIDFHKNRDFNNEIFVDEQKNKAYAYFKKNNVSSIKEIDLSDGSICNETVIPDYLFIEKIKINNGIVYFLYKEKKEGEYKKLYKMKI